MQALRFRGRAETVAKEYRERLDAMLGPAVRALDGRAEIEVKHFFSGAAAYALTFTEAEARSA